jgi:tetratricopeptide (TPR) repeat protein
LIRDFSLVLIIFVLFSDFALARRTGDINLKIRLTNIGYQEEAEGLIALISKAFPHLYELKTLTPGERVIQLADMIRDKIVYKKGVFELPDILNLSSADCLGYSQLFYILGKEIGLDVEIILIDSGRASNLIILDSGYMILHLAQAGPSYYLSGIFKWEDNYKEEDAIWHLNRLRLLPKNYSYVQRLDRRGIMAAVYNNRGGSKAKAILYSAILESDKALESSLYENEDIRYWLREAVKDFDRAIELNPHYGDAYYNRGQVRLYLGQRNRALADFKEAVRINPKLYDRVSASIQILLEADD